MNSVKSILKIVLPLLIGAIFVWYSLSQISVPTLLQYFKEANYFWIILGVVLGVISHTSRAYRWLLMCEPLGYKPKLANSFMAVFSAYLINFTIPRAGEIARASIITNYEKIPFEKGFGTIVAERVADTIMLLLIIIVALFLEFNFIYDFLVQKFNAVILIIASMGIFFLVAIFYLFVKRSSSVIAIKIKKFINGLVEGALSIFKMKHKWSFIFHTVFIWIMYLLMFYVTTFAISDLINISLAPILIGFILASFSIAATNGGIGSFPEAIVIALVLFNLPEDPSRAFGWIMWTSQTLMIVIIGGLSILYLPIYNRNK
ncbi:lysylphosphatidylglycerol synthase transmembrane domain-containing protein [Winogradskyella poriferorum]|uniref:lysylphosphatidylglycerol synthase transmembrane domain-containing protein n=1 Tax=Winogradskyella poriferorum TaxID=307627 RepID=UPI003D651519